MGVGASHCGMRHPDLLIGPAFLACARCQRLPEQRELRAIGGAGVISEICGDVPPLDPEIRMRAMVLGKREAFAGDDLGIAARISAEPGKALCPCWLLKCKQR